MNVKTAEITNVLAHIRERVFSMLRGTASTRPDIRQAWLPMCLAVMMLSSCGAPIVSDTTDWEAQNGRDFTLSIDRPYLTTVDAVRLRFTRHYWPGFDSANIGETASEGGSEPPSGSGIGGVLVGWRASGAGLDTAPDSHHLFYQWEVDYSQPFGFGSGTARTGVLDFVIGCPPDEIATQLRDMQTAVMAAHDTEDPIKTILPTYLPHGTVSIQDTGVGFAFAGGAVLGQIPGYPTSLVQAAPSIVLYRPRPQREGESDAAYVAAITDPTGYDGPYALIGWAYGAAYNPSQRPILGCIPSSAWFVHEAGFHRANGAMDLYPVDEDVPGEAPVSGVLPPPGAPQSADATFWHPRAWDLHVWLDGESTTPVLRIFSPSPVPGIDASGLFFAAETFE